ncbi:MAG: hypothetical protein AB7G75_03135 [Candidatus Binatia bacterium]
MADQQRTVISSSQMHIQTKVCPRGHVYLYVGHACLFLQQEEFLNLAQIVHATEKHLLENQGVPLPEQHH